MFDSRPASSSPFIAVEVGGFLGDCLLWLTAYLGPSAVRALEVEPVAAATRRLHESIAGAGFSDAFTVRTEPVGGGSGTAATDRSRSAATQEVGNRKRKRWEVAANPNFNGASGDPSCPGCSEQVMRTLDDLFAEWPALQPGMDVDLVRIKVSGNEANVLRGLHHSLAHRRVRTILVETSQEPLVEMLAFLQQFPFYQIQQRTLTSWNGYGTLKLVIERQG